MAGNENSGRRGFGQEVAALKEEIKRMTIEELAKEKVFNHIKMTKSKDRQGIKEIALPVYLKSKADKIQMTAEVNIGEKEKTLADETINNYLNDDTGDIKE